MTKSEKERLVRSYRTMAGRMFMHMTSKKIVDAGFHDQVKAAHDAACRVFSALENSND